MCRSESRRLAGALSSDTAPMLTVAAAADEEEGPAAAAPPPGRSLSLCTHPYPTPGRRVVEHHFARILSGPARIRTGDARIMSPAQIENKNRDPLQQAETRTALNSTNYAPHGNLETNLHT